MKIYGTHDDATVKQLERCVAAEDGAVGVLCADGHLGYSMPIGGVVGYRHHISPSGVGYDIACGNLAVRTPLRGRDLTEHDYHRIADQIAKRVSFGMGRSNNEPVEHPVFDAILQSPVLQQRQMIQMARNQLGTVGSGNHYVDVLEDADGYIWVGVHFGSRGFGHKTAKGFLNLAHDRAWDEHGGDDSMDAPPTMLRLDRVTAQDYIAAMQIAGDYAYAGRDTVVATVLNILGTTETDRVHNHHNFAWREEHKIDGVFETLWVVRKGATPAEPGQRGFVGGSMGDISVILRGVVSDEAKESLYSTVHGAGRVMSRSKAAGKTRTTSKWVCRNYRFCDFKGDKGGFQKLPNGPTPKCPNCGHKLDLRRLTTQVAPGLVNFAEVQEEMARRNIVLRGAGADEAPQVYRRLPDVLQQHAGTIAVEHVLMPRIVVMAGAEVEDAFRD